ncbi:unnamed protein product [Adineta ricciae]|uniref:Helix-turn-helix domain-containing protein n=1 Tax=Adineta ricciae TaxID=249248 RepID=A0A816D041_ADIRI|nr:unnamed protein product [Adineta ricciae]
MRRFDFFSDISDSNGSGGGLSDDSAALVVACLVQYSPRRKGQLIRAARLCSHVQDFNNERSNIEFTLLLNGYPPRFISYHFKKFFQQNNLSILMEKLDQVTYKNLHQHLINKSTHREHQKQQQTLNMNQYQYTNKKRIRVYQRPTVLQNFNTASYRVPSSLVPYRTVPSRLIII